MITGQAKSTSIDVNGNLAVNVEFTLTDGSKVNELLKYSCLHFDKAILLKDIKTRCEGYMYKIYNKNQNVELAKTNVTDVIYECTSVERVISGKDEPIVTITIDDK